MGGLAQCLNFQFVGLPGTSGLSEYLRPDPNGPRGFGGPARFSKMSLLRNWLLAHARRLHRYDYFAMVDGDLDGRREWLPGRPQLAYLERQLLEAGVANGLHGLNGSLHWGGLSSGWAHHSVLASIARANAQLGDSGWSAVCFNGAFGR